jgi:hypothetical protein
VHISYPIFNRREDVSQSFNLKLMTRLMDVENLPPLWTLKDGTRNHCGSRDRPGETGKLYFHFPGVGTPDGLGERDVTSCPSSV